MAETQQIIPSGVDPQGQQRSPLEQHIWSVQRLVPPGHWVFPSGVGTAGVSGASHQK
jgi:hypothetical protein